jgi:branched-chain amino acid transport system permease protein
VIPTDPVHLFGLTTTSAFDLLSLVVAVIFLAALQLFIVKSKWGLAIRAAAFDLKTAGLMGINVSMLISIVFFVAGMLAAVGGIFLSVRYTLYPQLGAITIKAFVAAVVGGLGSLPGAVIGSLILGLAEMLTAGFISSQLRDLVVFSLLVITLLVKPTGLLGKKPLEKV